MLSLWVKNNIKHVFQNVLIILLFILDDNLINLDGLN